MRRVMLDTCAFIFAATAPERLGREARAVLARLPAIISSVSLQEIAIKVAVGKLDKMRPLVRDWKGVLDAQRLGLAPITPDQIMAVADLPFVPHPQTGRRHADPFDRMIVAQAIDMNVPLVTPDPAIRQYRGLHAVW